MLVSANVNYAVNRSTNGGRAIIWPIAFAMGAARGTNNIFKSWCRMFSGQLLLLIMNAWCLKLFVNMVGEFLANPLSL